VKFEVVLPVSCAHYGLEQRVGLLVVLGRSRPGPLLRRPLHLAGHAAAHAGVGRVHVHGDRVAVGHGLGVHLRNPAPALFFVTPQSWKKEKIQRVSRAACAARAWRPEAWAEPRGEAREMRRWEWAGRRKPIGPETTRSRDMSESIRCRRPLVAVQSTLLFQSCWTRWCCAAYVPRRPPSGGS
jgi:hypothetical protein